MVWIRGSSWRAIGETSYLLIPMGKVRAVAVVNTRGMSHVESEKYLDNNHSSNKRIRVIGRWPKHNTSQYESERQSTRDESVQR